MDFDFRLFQLIKQWLEHESSCINKWLLGLKSAASARNLVSCYIKHEFPNVQESVLKKHFDSALDSVCTEDHIHCMDKDEMRNTFLEQCRLAEPLPLPEHMYIGRDWWIFGDTKASERHRELGFGGGIMVTEMQREFLLKFRIRREEYNDGVAVRKGKSPFPGTIMRYPLKLANLEELESCDLDPFGVNEKRLILVLNGSLERSDFLNFYYSDKLAVPRDDEEGVREWIESMLKIFIRRVEELGISFCD